MLGHPFCLGFHTSIRISTSGRRTSQQNHWIKSPLTDAVNVRPVLANLTGQHAVSAEVLAAFDKSMSAKRDSAFLNC